MMGMSSRLKKLSRYASLSIVFIVFIAFLGQTTTTTSYNIDLSSVTNLLAALLPVFVSIMVIVLIFKFVGSIFESFSRLVRQAKIYAVRLAPKLMTIAFVIIIVFLGQTSSSSTIDLTPIVSLLTSLLPLIVSILVIVLVFRLIGGLVEGLSSVFKQQVKIKASLRSMFIRAIPVALIVLGQTTSPSVDQAQQIVAQLTPILMTLITIVILIAVPILVFKVLAKSIIDIIRG